MTRTTFHYSKRKKNTMKKVLKDMIIKWHERGYTVDEIAPLVPQVPRMEIETLLKQYEKDKQK